jgi:WD40 repeat protein
MNPAQRRLLLAVALLFPGASDSADAPRAQAGSGPQRPGPARGDRHGDPLPRGARARLGTVRFRHLAPITFVGFSRDGRVLLSAGKDNFLRAWDVATGRELWRQEFDVRRRARPLTPVLCGDGTTIALSAKGLSILVLDAATGKERRRFRAADLRGPGGDGFSYYPFTLSRDGKLLVTHGGNYINTARDVALWDVASGKRVQHIEHVGESFYYVALTPDNKILLVWDNGFGQNKGCLRSWEVASGKELRAGEMSEAGGGELRLLPNGRPLTASIGPAEKLTLFDAATGKQWRRFRPGADKQPRPLAPGREVPLGFALSPDGKRLCMVARGEVSLWEIATGEEAGRFPHPFPRAEEGTAIAFAPDGRSLAVSGDRAVAVLDLATGRQRPTPAGHARPVSALAFSPTGAQVLSAAGGPSLRLWDRATGRELRRLNRHAPWPADAPVRFDDLEIPGFPCAFTPDGKTVAGVWPGGPIHLWDAASGKLLRRLDAPGPQHRLAFSVDGLLASAGMDGWVRLWDTGSGKEAQKLAWHRPPAKGEEPTGVIVGLAFTPNGKALAAAGMARVGEGIQPLISLREVATGARRQQMTSSAGRMATTSGGLEGVAEVLDNLALALAMSPDGKLLAVGGLTSIRVWDTATAKEVRWFGGPHLQGRTVAFSADGKILAAGRRDGLVRFWDTATGTTLLDHPAHEAAVTAVAFSPDGKTVATGSADTTVLVWDLAEVFRDSRPAPRPPSAAELRALWDDLASKDGARAYRAMGALSKAGAPSVALLKERLLKGKGPAQAVGLVRGLRAIEILERLGTAEARGVLEALAGGASEARLAREARASLKRLARHAPAP